MKVIIAGSRSITKFGVAEVAIKNSELKITEVVCGMASGVDYLGKCWAQRNNIRVTEMPAQWAKYGKRAGYLRNKQMAEYADALLLIWDGKSPGSANMKSEAIKAGLQVVEVIVK